MDTTKIAIKGSTQDHLEISDIRDDLVIQKDGSIALVIRISAINFALLSEKEQQAIIYAYGEFINSLNFSIQILIRSQQKDVSLYVNLLEVEQKKQTNESMKTAINKYRDFIVQTVKDNNVLDKKFYIVIPFSILEMGITKPSKKLPFPVENIIEKARITLTPKRDHIIRQLSRLSLHSKQLTTQELINLFYDIYNPQSHTQNTEEKNTKANFEKI